MADFQPDCESAKELYGQIMELNSLEISERLARFINQYCPALERQIKVNPVDIGKIKGECEAIENIALKYVRKASNFAKKKHKTADIGFRDDISGRYSKVTRDISDISRKVEEKIDETTQSFHEAKLANICAIPVLGMIAGPAIRASQFADTEPHTFEKVLASCAGFVAGIFEGVLSTVALGVPMAFAHSDEKRYAEQRKEYEEMKAILEKFRNSVSRHNDLLRSIRSLVSKLPERYIDGKKGLERGEDLKDNQINPFQEALVNIATACDVYIDYMRSRNIEINN